MSTSPADILKTVVPSVNTMPVCRTSLADGFVTYRTVIYETHMTHRSPNAARLNSMV